jgi:hypothetical protein
VPDVMSLEYRVCNAVLFMLQVEFEEVVTQVEAKVSRTMEHIKQVLCGTLLEVDPTLTLPSLEDSGLFLWSNPSFLTNWGAFVTALQHKDDIENDDDDTDKAKRKSVFRKIRKSVTSSITLSAAKRKASKKSDKALSSHFANVLLLAPLHEAYLDLTSKLGSPAASPYYFKSLIINSNNSDNDDAAQARQRDLSDCSSDTPEPKWYYYY